MLIMRPCPDVLRDLLEARGARLVRVYDIDEVHVIYTEEPYGYGWMGRHDPASAFGTHLSISAEGRHPTWEEQRDAVWAICPDITMASYIVPQGRHVTLPGSHVFHWFEVLPITGYVEHLGDWL
jgi:hypothetical protein